jgi:hypothetical protein
VIDYFFGKPRTGKSYRAVKYIYDGYIRDLEKGSNPKFKNILTNIGGFNFELVNKKFLDNGSSSRAYKLVWKDFYGRLVNLHKMAIADKSDDDLNKYADYHNINDSLIVLDEASLYLKKYDDVISWFLAYHGHFKVRIIIIAQSPKQILGEYLDHTEIFYEAQPQSKQLISSSLRYLHYSSIPFSKDNKFGSSSIKTDPKIYELYTSGEVDKPKKIIYKYIFMAIFAILFVIFVFKMLIANMEHRVKPNNSTSSSGVQTQANNSQMIKSNDLNVSTSFSNSVFITFNCFSDTCSNNNFKNVPRSFISFLIDKNKMLGFQQITVISSIYSKIDFIISSDSYDLLNRSFVSQTVSNSNFPPVASSLLVPSSPDPTPKVLK